MFTQLVRRQLVAFAIIGSLVAGYIMINYVQVGRLLDLGTIHVGLQLPRSGGLYNSAVVTYQGVQVGLVHEVRPTATGVEAELRIEDDADIPADLTAYVRSTSPVGEQYVELKPRTAGGPRLREGSVIPADRVVLPVSTGELIDRVNAMVQAIPKRSLNVVLDEAGTAFNGSGPALGTFLNSAGRFVSTAHDNLVPTVSLVDVMAPFLGTQVNMGPKIKSIFANLVPFTGDLAGRDPTVRSILDEAPDAMDEFTKLADDLDGPLPMFMANLTADAEVLKVYVPNIQNALILGPPVVTALQSTTKFRGDYVNLIISNMPLSQRALCKGGGQENHNSMSFQGIPTPPAKDPYCSAPLDSQSAARGARTSPCPNSSTRSAYAIDCGFDFRREIRPTSKGRVTPYNPSSGRFLGPDGKFFQLGASPTKAPTDTRSFLLRPLGLGQ